MRYDLNAIIHRNYQSPTDIQIKIFDRKIVFFNPSGLYGDITVDELKTDRYTASTRNKLIAEAFYLTNDIEKYGSGFIRIRQAIASYPTMKYDFYVMGNGCFSELSYERQKISTVEIEDGGLSGGLNERQKSVLQMIKETPGLNLKTVAEKTNIPVDTLDKYLRLLVKLQMVERRGSKKTGGYWAIDKITE